MEGYIELHATSDLEVNRNRIYRPDRGVGSAGSHGVRQVREICCVATSPAKTWRPRPSIAEPAKVDYVIARLPGRTWPRSGPPKVGPCLGLVPRRGNVVLVLR